MFEPCSVHVVYVWEDLSFCDELSFTLSLLFFSASTVAAYISTAPTCDAIIVSLEPCAINVNF